MPFRGKKRKTTSIRRCHWRKLFAKTLYWCHLGERVFLALGNATDRAALGRPSDEKIDNFPISFRQNGKRLTKVKSWKFFLIWLKLVSTHFSKPIVVRTVLIRIHFNIDSSEKEITKKCQCVHSWMNPKIESILSFFSTTGNSNKFQSTSIKRNTKAIVVVVVGGYHQLKSACDLILNESRPNVACILTSKSIKAIQLRLDEGNITPAPAHNRTHAHTKPNGMNETLTVIKI